MNSPMRLLLIDDDEVDRQAIIRAFKQTRMTLDICESATARDGLQMAAKQQFDAILLDYRLPDRDGIDVLHSLRSGNFDPVPVVMLSHHDDEHISEQCFNAGAQDFVLKNEVSGLRLSRAVQQARLRYGRELTLSNSQEQLRKLAECDPLTGLSNRRGFSMKLNAAVARAKRHQIKLALLLIDLDDFKNVNDTLGHDVGDLLLVEVAHRLHHWVNEGDAICRLGGDEFVVLCSELEHHEQAAFLVERLLAIFRQPFRLEHHDMWISASIGIAVLDDSCDNAVDLLKHADLAMYRAKQDGRNQSRFYCDKMHHTLQQMASLRIDLQQALQRQEFEIHYQAQVRTHDQQLCGLAAHLRWQHPRLGTLLPQQFMVLAEEIGLGHELGAWLLQQACQQFKAWQMAAPEKLKQARLSIDLSLSQLRDRALLRVLDRTLLENLLDPHCLEFAITENALNQDTSAAISMLNSLEVRGLHLALCDFGSEPGSLQLLQSFPLHGVKIDARFVAGIGCSRKQEQLLLAMIRFAQALELQVVAAGVETAAQAAFCRLHGCDLLQGDYLAYASGNAAALAAWLNLSASSTS